MTQSPLSLTEKYTQCARNLYSGLLDVQERLGSRGVISHDSLKGTQGSQGSLDSLLASPPVLVELSDSTAAFFNARALVASEQQKRRIAKEIDLLSRTVEIATELADNGMHWEVLALFGRYGGGTGILQQVRLYDRQKLEHVADLTLRAILGGLRPSVESIKIDQASKNSLWDFVTRVHQVCGKTGIGSKSLEYLSNLVSEFVEFRLNPGQCGTEQALCDTCQYVNSMVKVFDDFSLGSGNQWDVRREWRDTVTANSAVSSGLVRVMKQGVGLVSLNALAQCVNSLDPALKAQVCEGSDFVQTALSLCALEDLSSVAEIDVEDRLPSNALWVIKPVAEFSQVVDILMESANRNENRIVAHFISNISDLTQLVRNGLSVRDLMLSSVVRPVERIGQYLLARARSSTNLSLVMVSYLVLCRLSTVVIRRLRSFVFARLDVAFSEKPASPDQSSSEELDGALAGSSLLLDPVLDELLACVSGVFARDVLFEYVLRQHVDSLVQEDTKTSAPLDKERILVSLSNQIQALEPLRDASMALKLPDEPTYGSSGIDSGSLHRCHSLKRSGAEFIEESLVRALAASLCRLYKLAAELAEDSRGEVEAVSVRVKTLLEEWTTDEVGGPAIDRVKAKVQDLVHVLSQLGPDGSAPATGLR